MRLTVWCEISGIVNPSVGTVPRAALGRMGPAAVEPLTAALRDRRGEVRAAAALALGMIGPEAASALPDLIQLLDDDQELVRLRAATAAGALGEIARDSLLAEILVNPSPRRRQGAIEALRILRSTDAEVIDVLGQAARDTDAGVREAAFLAIAASLGDRPVPENVFDTALEGLRDADLRIAYAAAAVLLRDPATAQRLVPVIGQLLTASETVPPACFLIRRLGIAARDVRGNLLDALVAFPEHRDATREALGRLGKIAVPDILQRMADGNDTELMSAIAAIGPDAAEPLFAALRDARPAVREVAAAAVRQIESLPPDAIGRLIAALGDEQPGVRASVTLTLAQFGPQAEQAIGKVVTLCDDANPAVRAAAVTCLATISDKPAAHLTRFEKSLTDPDAEVRVAAARAIAEVGPAAAATAPALAAAASDAEGRVRQAAIRGIGRIGPAAAETAATAVVEALADELPDVRINAATAVGQLELPSERTLDRLVATLADPDPAVTLAGLATIAGYGPDAAAAENATRALADHPRPDVRMAALAAIAQIVADPDRRLQLLTSSLDDADWTVRAEAMRLLAKMGRDARAAVPRIFELLTSRDDEPQASRTLRDIGDADPEMVGPFVAALDSKDRRVRGYAVFLLGQIGPPAREALPETSRTLRFQRPASQAVSQTRDQENRGRVTFPRRTRKPARHDDCDSVLEPLIPSFTGEVSESCGVLESRRTIALKSSANSFHASPLRSLTGSTFSPAASCFATL